MRMSVALINTVGDGGNLTASVSCYLSIVKVFALEKLHLYFPPYSHVHLGHKVDCTLGQQVMPI